MRRALPTPWKIRMTTSQSAPERPVIQVTLSAREKRV
jgi:hypothetical protein